ncbi:MAG: DPP IV N-terminal domain-containing protein [Salinivirgaceae bacterium]|nr:DPP IV N-terminal domain-containing protein [Salinivirgaceae bacterium]
MKRLTFLFLIAIISTVLIGQDKLFTIEEAVIGQWRELYPKTIWNINWKGESNTLTFKDQATIYGQSVNSSDSSVILNLDELNAALVKTNLDSIKHMPNITWANNEEFDFQYNNTWVYYSLNKNKVLNFISIPENAENINVFVEKVMIAYTIKNNLFVIGTDNKAIQVSNDEDENIVNGTSVSRNEFGIDGGIFWSPKGNYLAFYRKDESKVKDYPLVDITAREAELANIKYPMAGMSSEHVSLGVFNLKTQSTTFIEKEDTISEKYLTNITWAPNEESIYIQVLNRDQNHMKLNSYDLSGKLIKTLFEEKNDKYVEPQHKLIFLPSNEDQFIYQTRNDGFNHAYIYKTSGELVKQLTKGEWEIIDILNVDSKYMYYTSTAESPIELHFYKVALKSGKIEKLTTEKGTHNITLNKNGKYFIDKYSNTETPNVIQLVSTKGDIVRSILKATNPLSEYNMPKMEIGTIKAADGVTDLYYRLIKPIDFDSTKKYPAIIYVYGGPHAQLINDQWLGGARMWNYYMAQKGYVMLTVDNRGSANRGLEFENVIHRQCGVNEMKDQMEGVKLLEGLGFVAMDKIGVSGWSYGGFMTISLMINYPETFKVGTAGGPVIDWKYYEIMYGERYMDTPEQNPEGYQYTSLLPRARDLKGKLLIIQGAIDNTVVWQHSQSFVRECIKNRVPVDYFVYPRAEHNVRGYDRIHLMDKISNYYIDYLK